DPCRAAWPAVAATSSVAASRPRAIRLREAVAVTFIGGPSLAWGTCTGDGVRTHARTRPRQSRAPVRSPGRGKALGPDRRLARRSRSLVRGGSSPPSGGPRAGRLAIAAAGTTVHL